MKLSIIKGIFLYLLFFSTTLYAAKNKGVGKTTPPKNSYGYSTGKEAAPCAAAVTQVEMDVNNVRTTLNSNGDLWWNLSDAKYEIPKLDPPSPSTAVHSIFAGALWIGGIDATGQLKVAAQTYRQTGNDFWSGPLVGASKEATSETCAAFDKIYKINGSTITLFRNNIAANGGTLAPADIPEEILNWPARNNANNVEVQTHATNMNLAPFVNVDLDPSSYDPTQGDYPALVSVTDDTIIDVIPDQMLWWVSNDRGNVHSESGSDALGLQIRTLAFSFATNDDVNNMTFYKYEIDYYGSATLNQTYFGVWVDPDLGCYDNDFVGCDTTRELGIVYNGTPTDIDCASKGYGNEVPMLGVDFFKGPKDTAGNILGASGFVYYNNDFSVIGNPENMSHFYGYLSGYWKDGQHFTCGGNGRGGTTNCDFMFPDPPNMAGGWSECSIGNTPSDRRFLHVSGPFALVNGAANEIITGVVWVRPTDYCGSFDKIGLASDKAQKMFENNFKIKNGPYQPRLAIRELDQELTFALFNDSLSNNYKESYVEYDPTITPPTGMVVDTLYRFQGYKVYQLKDNTVGVNNLSDASKARLVFQCDIKDSIEQIINFVYEDGVGTVPVPKLEQVENNGIRNTFNLKTDAFQSGALVNQKAYYFLPLAYAYNNFLEFDEDNASNTQAEPYIESRKSQDGGLHNYVGIPHKSTAENGGMVLNAEFGDGPEITRIEGVGNSNNLIELTDASIAEILANDSMDYPTYKAGKGPIDIKIYDPTLVPANKFRIELVDPTPTSISEFVDLTGTWKLTNLTTGESILSNTSIGQDNEQGCPTFDPNESWGFSVSVKQTNYTGITVSQRSIGNNVMHEDGNDVVYESPEKIWLNGLKDEGNEGYQNWILSGEYNPDTDGGDASCDAFDSYTYPADFYIDPFSNYEKIGTGTLNGTGTWAPYAMTSALKSNILVPSLPNCAGYSTAYGPSYQKMLGVTMANNLRDLHNVDIVLTDDRSKWTQCVVIEMGEITALNEGGARKHDIRKHASLDINGNPIAGETGRSWFPGYAIDLETGDRLNIIFSENSFLTDDRGNDMLWNPTSNVLPNREPFIYGNPILGGMHYIYVMNTRYDGGARYKALLDPGTSLQNVYKECMWTSMSYVSDGYDIFKDGKITIPTTTKVRLRIAHPYENYKQDNSNGSMPAYEFDMTKQAAVKSSTAVNTTILDEINVVPNPYMAYSYYETGPLDTKVKITNLPNTCKITIFNTSGTIIRTYKRDTKLDGTTGGYNSEDLAANTIEWDLQNSKGVPIASGMYMIHIDAEGVGEKTLKFFAVMRPTDVNSY